VAGGFEQKNIVTVNKILRKYFGRERQLDRFLDLTHVREGQDIRYALNDDKLRSLGWEPNKKFDVEIGSIVEYYKHNFKW
jgi:dTDP-D-glucose 4,6-dehydratase